MGVVLRVVQQKFYAQPTITWFQQSRGSVELLQFIPFTRFVLRYLQIILLPVGSHPSMGQDSYDCFVSTVHDLTPRWLKGKIMVRDLQQKKDVGRINWKRDSSVSHHAVCGLGIALTYPTKRDTLQKGFFKVYIKPACKRQSLITKRAS